MNVLVISGNLGSDCKVESTQSGMTICKFSVANTTGYGDRKNTNWINCALFGKRAEGGLVQYLKKGAKVIASGEFNIRKFDKKDGSVGYSHELNVNDITLLDSQQPSQHNTPHQQAKQNGYAPQDVPPNGDLDDSIPF